MSHSASAARACTRARRVSSLKPRASSASEEMSAMAFVRRVSASGSAAAVRTAAGGLLPRGCLTPAPAGVCALTAAAHNTMSANAAVHGWYFIANCSLSLTLALLREHGARDGERGGGARRFACERLGQLDRAVHVLLRERGEDAGQVERRRVKVDRRALPLRLHARSETGVRAGELRRAVRGLDRFRHQLPSAIVIDLEELRGHGDEAARAIWIVAVYA